jgi:hypothetical protein
VTGFFGWYLIYWFGKVFNYNFDVKFNFNMNVNFLTPTTTFDAQNNVESRLVSRSGNFFHAISYYLQKPLQLSSEFFLWAICTPIRPGIDGNYANLHIEKVRRLAMVCLCISLAPTTISFYLIGEAAHCCGNAINKIPYTIGAVQE